MSTTLRVPLTYHVQYKGRAVTVQALCPVSDRTVVAEPMSDPEWEARGMELAACFNLRSYDVDGVARHMPPAVQCHAGLDGRMYIVGNYQWRPRLPPATAKRRTPNVFGAVRMAPLVRSPHNVFPRSFHGGSLIHENRSMTNIAAAMTDVDVHSVARAGEDIVQAFRDAGLNCSLLGVLLLSLLRSVSPPEELVDAVIVEITARGIKQYVCGVMCPGDEEEEPEAKPLNRGVDGGGDAGAPAPFDFGFAIAAVGLGDDGTRFAHVLQEVLRDVLEYPGERAPRAATFSEPEVPLPSSRYGGRVLPVVYRKFRLLYDDVDLFQAWSPAMRRAIYARVCYLAGARVTDGCVEAAPIVGVSSAIKQPLAAWAATRSDVIAGRVYYKELASRVAWQRDGAALVLLTRLRPDHWRFYDKLCENLRRIEPAALHQHVLANNLRLDALEEHVERERAALPGLTGAASACRMVAVVHKLRTLAAAYAALDRAQDARDCLAAALRLGEAVFERTQSSLFAPQFRALVQHRRDVGDPRDLAPLEDMLRVMLKCCQLDAATAVDYVTLAVMQQRYGHESDAAANFSRARHVLQQFVADDDPRVVVCLANLAALNWSRSDDAAPEIRDALRVLAASPNCPPAVLRLAADVEASVNGENAGPSDELRERATAYDAAVAALHHPVDYTTAPTMRPR
jgi:hypothetical protein